MLRHKGNRYISYSRFGVHCVAEFEVYIVGTSSNTSIIWFFLDFQAVLLHPEQVMYDVSVDTLGNMYNQAKEWLNKYFMVSDVAFLFTPPQIAPCSNVRY